MTVDRWAASNLHLIRPPHIRDFDGEPRFAMITVNFSTTRLLQLMLLTLCEQIHLPLLRRIIVVDNGSRDGGGPFLTQLARRCPRITLVERNRWLYHGPAMRAGVQRLDRIDAGDPSAANLLLFCDPDVVFLDTSTLGIVARCFADGAVLAGERRPGRRAGPNIQASFFAVRRDVHARRDVKPLLHDGAPAYRLQLSIARAGLEIADIPSNHGGMILHRGRSGVAAATMHRPWHQYASVERNAPHFMGVPGGSSIWGEVEERYRTLLDPNRQSQLLDHLECRLR